MNVYDDCIGFGTTRGPVIYHFDSSPVLRKSRISTSSSVVLGLDSLSHMLTTSLLPCRLIDDFDNPSYGTACQLAGLHKNLIADKWTPPT